MKAKLIFKFGLFSTLGIALYNEYINVKTNMDNVFESNKYKDFSSSIGKIKYRVFGPEDSSPILLIHNISIGDNDNEWNQIINKYPNRKIYSINLPGCGNSDKNLIQYTNFIYSKIIYEFINNVICEKTDIITSGNSCISVLLSKIYNDKNNNLINKIIFINPPKSEISNTNNSNTRLVRKIINLPLIGTFLYTRNFKYDNILDIMKNKFYNNSSITSEYIKTYYDSIYFNNANSKFLYTSIKSNLLKDNISHIIKQNNNFYIICSSKYTNIINYYSDNIDSDKIHSIDNCFDYPHIEQSNKVIEIINNIL